MSGDVKEVFESMSWGDEYVKWEDFREYYKDDKAWKSDELTTQFLAQDLRVIIRNFQDLLDAALGKEPKTWQERLSVERAELNKRVWKLESALHGPDPAVIPSLDRSVLQAQLISMVSYLGILDARLAAQALEDLPKEVSGE